MSEKRQKWYELNEPVVRKNIKLSGAHILQEPRQNVVMKATQSDLQHCFVVHWAARVERDSEYY